MTGTCKESTFFIFASCERLNHGSMVKLRNPTMLLNHIPVISRVYLLSAKTELKVLGSCPIAPTDSFSLFICSSLQGYVTGEVFPMIQKIDKFTENATQPEKNVMTCKIKRKRKCHQRYLFCCLYRLSGLESHKSKI